MASLNKVRKKISDEARENIRAARIKWAEENAKGVSLKPNGYVEYTRGIHKGRTVHDVVMEELLGRKLLPGEIVHHKNGIRNDNRIENLQLLTRAEHSRIRSIERQRMGLCYDISKETKCGENHPKAKLSNEDVLWIRRSNLTNKTIALMYNVSVSCIKHIKAGRSWKQLW